MDRRRLLQTTLLAAVALPLATAFRPFAASAQEVAGDPRVIGDDERILGMADAPVTIFVYESLTCPHCAQFHATTLQDLKTKYVEPGKVRLIFRDFPLDGLALRASMVAHCVEGDAYFDFLDTLFARQSSWSRDEDPLGALAKLAKWVGIDDDRFKACVEDEAVMNRILQGRLDGHKGFDITSTPTFMINAEAKIVGAQSLEEFEKILLPLLEKS